MSQLDLNTLFQIAEASDLFDRVEAQMRAAGHTSVADEIVKLQQDAGLEINREMTGPDEEPAPGPETAALRAAYRPTSPERLKALIINMTGSMPDSPDVQKVITGFDSLFATPISPSNPLPPAP